jgi:hypothetical protein
VTEDDDISLGDVLAILFGLGGLAAVTYGIVLLTSAPPPADESGVGALAVVGQAVVGWALIISGVTALVVVAGYSVVGRSPPSPPSSKEPDPPRSISDLPHANDPERVAARERRKGRLTF